ncbi:hypothetical protein WKV44_09765 [Spirochaetia bacterium 38H-sp]|uniref:SEC-C motif-containing protein n=1 Tax=Rarispira pelagica TaxID=3141764 RepID=A0ABU9UDT0_9SPIR
MGELNRLYNNAIRALARHDKERALRIFKRYISICPAEDKRLARVLKFTGNILWSLGLKKQSLRVWTLSCKIERQPYLALRIRYAAHGSTDVSSFQSDRNLFFSIQQEKYLSSKTCKHYTSNAERDMIFELISEYWKDFLRTYPHVLSLRREEKIRLFYSVEIVFPFVAVDYMQKTRAFVSFFDSASENIKCSCGSGLPYRLCCGSKNNIEDWPVG